MSSFKQTSDNSGFRSSGSWSWLLPFGITGTLVLAGVMGLFSPLSGMAIAATPLAYLTVKKFLPSVWLSLKKSAYDVFHPERRKIPDGQYGKLKVSNGCTTGNELVDVFVGKLRSDGLQVSTDWKAAKAIINNLPDRFGDLRKSGGKIYGFVYQGTVFLNGKEASPDVPIHEYTHVWAEAMRQQNPQEWKYIVELMKQEKSIWKNVSTAYPHLKADDEIADEVLATYSGRHGAIRLSEHCVDGRDIKKGFKSLVTALERFWKNVSQSFGKDIHYVNASDLADRVLSDFLNGVNPNRYIDAKKIALSGKVVLASQKLSEPVLEFSKGRMEHLLSIVLPDKGRIELPHVFCLDQPISIGTYDLDARYLIRGEDGIYRLSDGEYSLPISRVMKHQTDELCSLLEEYLENSSSPALEQEEPSQENMSDCVINDVSVVDIVISRIKDPGARAFTKEQADSISDYFSRFDAGHREGAASALYSVVASSQELDNVPLAWKEDVKEELSKLSQGRMRELVKGIHF